MEILISQNAQNKAQICASSLGGNVSILWGFHGSCNCIYTKIPCLYFLSLCVHQTLMCYWVTAWCWSVLLCMPCLTWVRSTRWRTWAGWSSWAWWDFSGRWSVVYKCNLLHCNVALRWWEDVLKWVRCASNVSELCNHQDYWCLHLLIVLSFKWISFLTSWTWAFLVVLFQLC